MQYQKVYMNQMHPSSLLEQLSRLWKKDILCDAVLTIGTTSVKAHRVVLVAACPMLQCMNAAEKGTVLEVKLTPDIKQTSVNLFLHYLYDGFMVLSEDTVHDVERIARLLQVDGIIKCCMDFFKTLEEQTDRDNLFRCRLETDTPVLKHIKTSDLLLSQTNSGEKNKPCKTSNENSQECRKDETNMAEICSSSQSSIVDSFKSMIDSCLESSPCDSEMNQMQSIGISVKSTGKQSVEVIDMDETSAGSTSSRQSYAENQSHMLSIDRNVYAGNQNNLPHGIGLQSSTKPSNEIVDHKGLNRHKRKPFSLTHYSGSVSKKAQLSSSSVSSEAPLSATDLRSSPLHDVSHNPSDHNSVQDGPVTRLSSPVMSVPTGPTTLNSDGSIKHGRQPSERERDIQSEGSGIDMSIVKRERQEQADNCSTQENGVDDDGSDSESQQGFYSNYHHMDTNPIVWHTQTFKDRGKLDEMFLHHTSFHQKDKEDASSKARSSPLLSHRTRISSPHNTSLSIKHHLSVKQKVVRALSMLKSPIVFLRPLQRKLNSIKVDDLKVICQLLSEDGFGQFVLKHQSNILQRDAFFKASPLIIQEENAILRESQVSHNLYVHNFNDISELTDEEVKLLWAAHPEKDYVQKLCEGHINRDDKEVQSLEAAAVMPPFMPMFYGSHSQGAMSPKSMLALSSTTSSSTAGSGYNGHFADTPSVPSAEEFRMMLTTPLSYDNYAESARKKAVESGGGTQKANTNAAKENYEGNYVKKEH